MTNLRAVNTIRQSTSLTMDKKEVIKSGSVVMVGLYYRLVETTQNNVSVMVLAIRPKSKKRWLLGVLAKNKNKAETFRSNCFITAAKVNEKRNLERVENDRLMGQSYDVTLLIEQNSNEIDRERARERERERGGYNMYSYIKLVVKESKTQKS